MAGIDRDSATVLGGGDPPDVMRRQLVLPRILMVFGLLWRQIGSVATFFITLGVGWGWGRGWGGHTGVTT